MEQRKVYKGDTMNKKIILLICIFLLNMCIVNAIENSTVYNITELPTCYGNISIKLTSQKNIEKGEYSFVNCKETNSNFWSCDCTDKNIINLEVSNQTNNTYDVRLEYYIEPHEPSSNVSNLNPTEVDIENDNKKRIKNIGNLSFGTQPVVIPKEPVKMPEFTGGVSILIVIGILFLSIMFLALISYRWITAEERKEKKEIKKQKRKEQKVKEQKEDVNNDDVLDNILKDIDK